MKIEEIRELMQEIKIFYKKHPTAKFSDSFLCGMDEGFDELYNKLKQAEELSK